MLRYLKADFYRILKSKGFYIALIMLVIFSFVNAYLPFGFEFGISSGRIELEKWSKFIMTEVFDEKNAGEAVRNTKGNTAYEIWQENFAPEAEFEYAKEMISKGEYPDYSDETRLYIHQFKSRGIYETHENYAEYVKTVNPVSGENFEILDSETKESVQKTVENAQLMLEAYRRLNLTNEEKQVLIHELYNFEYDQEQYGYSENEEFFKFMREKCEPMAEQILSRISDLDAYNLLTSNPEAEDYFEMNFMYRAGTNLGSLALFKSIHGGTVIFYFILASASMFFMKEFSSHTFKNSLSSKFSRGTVYAEKVLGISIMSMFFYALYILTNVIFSIILNGWNSEFSGSEFLLFIKCLSVQLPVLLFFIGFAVFLTALFKKPAPYNVTYIILPIALAVCLLLAGELLLPEWTDSDPRWETFDFLKYARFDFYYVFTNISITLHEVKDWLTTIVYPLVIAAFCFVGGGILFKKHEVK